MTLTTQDARSLARRQNDLPENEIAVLLADIHRMKSKRSSKPVAVEVQEVLQPLRPSAPVWDPKKLEEADKRRRAAFAEVASKIAMDNSAAQVKTLFRRQELEKRQELHVEAEKVVQAAKEERLVFVQEHADLETKIRRRKKEEKRDLAMRNARSVARSKGGQFEDILSKKMQKAEDSRQRQWDEWVAYRNRNTWNLPEETMVNGSASQFKKEVQETHQEFQDALSAAVESRERWQSELIKNHKHMKHEIVYGAGDNFYVPDRTPEPQEMERKSTKTSKTSSKISIRSKLESVESESEYDDESRRPTKEDQRGSEIASEGKNDIQMIDVPARPPRTFKILEDDVPKRASPGWGRPPAGGITPHRQQMMRMSEEFEIATASRLSDKFHRRDQRFTIHHQQREERMRSEAEILALRTKQAEACRQEKVEERSFKLVEKAETSAVLVASRLAVLKEQKRLKLKEEKEKREQLVAENFERQQAVVDLNYMISTLQHRLAETKREERAVELVETKKQKLADMRNKEEARAQLLEFLGKGKGHLYQVDVDEEPEQLDEFSLLLEERTKRTIGFNEREDLEQPIDQQQLSNPESSEKEVIPKSAFSKTKSEPSPTSVLSRSRAAPSLSTPPQSNASSPMSAVLKVKPESSPDSAFSKIKSEPALHTQSQSTSPQSNSSTSPNSHSTKRLAFPKGKSDQAPSTSQQMTETDSKRPDSKGSDGSEKRPASESESDSFLKKLKAEEFEEALKTFVHKRKHRSKIID